MAITAIDAQSVSKITSGQVVTSIASAIKELVENSLDAGATLVEVKLNSHGREGFSVQDNGSGIDPQDFDMMAVKHATSKLQQFADLGKVTTLGFRGEALASICALAKVEITTNDHQVELSTEGKVVSNITVPTPKGTLVSVTDLFRQLPVRRKDLERNFQREFSKTVSMLQEYALISTARFIVEHTQKGRRTVVLRSQGNELLQRIACVYGGSRVSTLMPLNVPLGIDTSIEGYISQPVFGKGDYSGDHQLLFINGRPTKQLRLAKAVTEVYKQFNFAELPFFVLDLKLPSHHMDVNITPDKRTVLLHEEGTLLECLRVGLVNAFEQAGHSLPRTQSQAESIQPQKKLKQSVISLDKFLGSGEVVAQEDLDLTADPVPEPQEVPGNVEAVVESADTPQEAISSDTPRSTARRAAKSTIETYLQAETEDGIEETAETTETTEATCIIDTDNIEYPNIGDASPVTSAGSSSRVQSSFHPISRPTSKSSMKSRSSRFNSVILSDETPDSDFDSGRRQTRLSSRGSSFGAFEEFMPASDITSLESAQSAPTKSSGLQNSNGNASCCGAADLPSASAESVGDNVPDSVDENSVINSTGSNDRSVSEPSAGSTNNQSSEEPEERASQRRTPLKQTLNYYIRMPINLDMVKSAVTEDVEERQNKPKIKQFAIDEVNAEERLSLTVRKGDFAKMRIVGQFNLGFILVVKTSPSGKHDDLFVIDQHASDEIYNFERLQRTTVLSKQPMVVPQLVELSAVEELTLVEHLRVFENNGFGLSVDQKAPPGQQCRITAKPYSKGTVFDEKDIHELIYKIKEDPENENLKCSKLRAMFAMRACRSSIMIGRPLSAGTMRRVVDHLGTLEKPWNCPHGRPTLRHITSLS